MGDISQIKQRILAGHEQATRGHAGWVNGHVEWVEGTLILAAAMKDGRDQFLADTAFGAWLKKSGLNFYNAHDRAALIGLGGNLLARKILTETTSHSYRLIWDQVQDRSRFGSAAKPRRSDVKKISDVKSEPERTETTAEAKKPEPEPVRPRPGKSDKPVDLGKLLDNQITAALATLTFEQFWRCLPVNWRSNIIAAANDRTGSQYRDDEAPAPSPSKWVN